MTQAKGIHMLGWICKTKATTALSLLLVAVFMFAVAGNGQSTGQIRLQDGDSYDFFAQQKGRYSGGEFYVRINHEGGNTIFANNIPQRGVTQLGDVGSPSLREVRIPETGYTRFGVPAIIGHTYVAKAQQGKEGQFVAFRITDLTSSSMSIRYAIRGGTTPPPPEGICQMNIFFPPGDYTSQVARFDTNGNGVIDDSECAEAESAWEAGRVSDAVFGVVIECWKSQAIITECAQKGQSNQAPSADFTWKPSNPEVGDSVTFDASASSDPDGSIVQFTWNFPDLPTRWSESGRVVRHTFGTSLRFQVCLRVRDGDGLTDETCNTVNVRESQEPARPPEAGFTFSPSNPQVNETVQFTDTSQDPDSNIVEWSWTFGDGGTSSRQNPTHTFRSTGNFDVCLTVTDNQGETDQACDSIRVNPEPTAPNVRVEVVTDRSNYDADDTVNITIRIYVDGDLVNCAKPDRVTLSGPGTSREITDRFSSVGNECQADIQAGSPGSWTVEAEAGTMWSCGPACDAYESDVGSANYTVEENRTSSQLRFTDAQGRSVSEYKAGDSVYVTVEDSDKNRSRSTTDRIRDAVTLENTRTGERLTVDVSETGSNSGDFRSSAISIDSPGASADLTVSGGDTLEAIYTDPDDSSDQSRATADVTGKALSIDSVEPDGQYVGRHVALKIDGQGLEGVNVTIGELQEGFSELNSARTHAKVDFWVPLTADPGVYDVVVRNSSGEEVTLRNAFEIKPWTSAAHDVTFRAEITSGSYTSRVVSLDIDVTETLSGSMSDNSTEVRFGPPDEFIANCLGDIDDSIVHPDNLTSLLGKNVEVSGRYDPNVGLVETCTDSNYYVTQDFETAKPQCQVQSVSIPDTAKVGEEVEMSGTIVNNGDGEGECGYIFDLRRSSPRELLITDECLPSESACRTLAPSETYEVSRKFTFNKAKSAKLTIGTGSMEQEEGNQIVRTITITERNLTLSVNFKPNSNAFNGTVKDENGNGMEGIQVSVEDPVKMQSVIAGETGADGSFTYEVDTSQIPVSRSLYLYNFAISGDKEIVKAIFEKSPTSEFAFPNNATRQDFQVKKINTGDLSTSDKEALNYVTNGLYNQTRQPKKFVRGQRVLHEQLKEKAKETEEATDTIFTVVSWSIAVGTCIGGTTGTGGTGAVIACAPLVTKISTTGGNIVVDKVNEHLHEEGVISKDTLMKRKAAADVTFSTIDFVSSTTTGDPSAALEATKVFDAASWANDIYDATDKTTNFKIIDGTAHWEDNNEYLVFDIKTETLDGTPLRQTMMVSGLEKTETSSTKQIDLREGWNSLYIGTDGSLSQSTLSRKCGNTKVISKNNGDLVEYTGSDLRSDSSYFVKTSESCTIGLNGEVLNKSSLSLDQGWNMTGASVDVPVESIRQACTNPVLIGIKEGQEDQKLFKVKDKLEAFNGYLIRVSDSCSVNLSQSQSASTTQPTLQAAPTIQQVPQGFRFEVQGQGVQSFDVSVFSLEGERVYHSGSVQGRQLTWRGTTSSGQRLANGVYLYVLTVRGPDGQVQRSEVKKLAILN